MDGDLLSAVIREIGNLPEFAGITPPSATMRNATGNSPLHVAATRGDREAVRVLLEAGADPNAVGEVGCTPLHRALEQKHVQVARMLVVAGGSLDVRNSDGVTAREMARDVPIWEGES